MSIVSCLKSILYSEHLKMKTIQSNFSDKSFLKHMIYVI